MIYIDMLGNLGNQLFEYAYARKIQELTGQKVTLNTCFLEKYYKDYKFNLNSYKLNENIIIELYVAYQERHHYLLLFLQTFFFLPLFFSFFRHHRAIHDWRTRSRLFRHTSQKLLPVALLQPANFCIV